MHCWKLLPGLALLALAGCGGGSSEASFIIEPDAPVVAAGDQVLLVAQPTADLGGEIQWEIQEAYGGGLLRTQGSSVTYVAPEAAGVYHLQLRAQRLDGRALKQTLTVKVVGISTIEPSNPRVAPGGTIAFTAHMRGLGKGGVRWSVQEAHGGEITEEGRYTAPGRAGSYHVVATSTVDPSVSAQATVLVEN